MTGGGYLLLAVGGLDEYGPVELRPPGCNENSSGDRHSGKYSDKRACAPAMGRRTQLRDKFENAIRERHCGEHEPQVGLLRAGPRQHSTKYGPVDPFALPYAAVYEPEAERTVHQIHEPPKMPCRKEREVVPHEPIRRCGPVARERTNAAPFQIVRHAKRREVGRKRILKLLPDVWPSKQEAQIAWHDRPASAEITPLAEKEIRRIVSRLIRLYECNRRRPRTPEDAAYGNGKECRKAQKPPIRPFHAAIIPHGRDVRHHHGTPSRMNRAARTAQAQAS